MTRRLLLSIGLGLSACNSAVDVGTDVQDMRGTWSYTAVQQSPSLDVRGTLQIDRQDGTEFSGTVSFRETDVQGTMRDRTGQMSGRVVGSSAVDFDIYFEEGSRRHVAGVKPDSMNGTWARMGASPPVTGSFSARKL